MFHKTNLPSSLVGDVAKILGDTNADYGLPSELQSKISVAAGQCARCVTQEDRKAICENYLVETYGDDLTNETRAQFHAAVEFAMRAGNYGDLQPEPQAKPEVISEVKKVKMSGCKMPYGFTQKNAKAMETAQNQRKKKQVKEQSELSEIELQNQEILAIVESLDDDEFGALLELLDDQQLANLEAVLDADSDDSNDE
jgi:hypothetical protein